MMMRHSGSRGKRREPHRKSCPNARRTRDARKRPLRIRQGSWIPEASLKEGTIKTGGTPRRTRLRKWRIGRATRKWRLVGKATRRRRGRRRRLGRRPGRRRGWRGVARIRRGPRPLGGTIPESPPTTVVPYYLELPLPRIREPGIQRPRRQVQTEPRPTRTRQLMRNRHGLTFRLCLGKRTAQDSRDRAMVHIPAGPT